MIAPMCMMCEGASRDEFQFHLHGLIQSHGWAVIPVVADRVDRSWAYTIGLAGNFEHPELVVAGLAPEPAGRLLNSIGGLVRDGVELRAGEGIVGTGFKKMRLEKVHDQHSQSGLYMKIRDVIRVLRIMAGSRSCRRKPSSVQTCDQEGSRHGGWAAQRRAP